jgi:hypothetical protein
MSNKDRIQKAAEEAKATAKEKKAKATAKRTTSRTKKVPARVRMKIVWAVCNPSGKILKTYLYPEKAAAEAEAARLTKSKKSEHKVRPEKVPME